MDQDRQHAQMHSHMLGRMHKHSQDPAAISNRPLLEPDISKGEHTYSDCPALIQATLFRDSSEAPVHFSASFLFGLPPFRSNIEIAQSGNVATSCGLKSLRRGSGSTDLLSRIVPISFWLGRLKAGAMEAF